MSCMVSNVGDMYSGRFPEKFPSQPWIQPTVFPIVPQEWPGMIPSVPAVSRDEFDALRREVVEMKEMLKRAKAFDEATSSPNCEIEEKMDLLRKIAALVGISLDDVIGPKPAGQGA